MDRFKPFLLVLAIGACLGCYTFESRTISTMPPAFKIGPGTTVMLPNVLDNGENGQGAGAKVYASTIAALDRRQVASLPTAAISLGPQLDEAAKASARYLIRVRIDEWDEHATAWSGQPDFGTITAEVYDVTTRALVATVTRRDHRQGGMSYWAKELPEYVVAEITRTAPVAPKR